MRFFFLYILDFRHYLEAKMYTNTLPHGHMYKMHAHKHIQMNQMHIYSDIYL